MADGAKIFTSGIHRPVASQDVGAGLLWSQERDGSEWRRAALLANLRGRLLSSSGRLPADMTIMMMMMTVSLLGTGLSELFQIRYNLRYLNRFVKVAS